MGIWREREEGGERNTCTADCKGLAIRMLNTTNDLLGIFSNLSIPLLLVHTL